MAVAAALGALVPVGSEAAPASQVRSAPGTGAAAGSAQAMEAAETVARLPQPKPDAFETREAEPPPDPSEAGEATPVAGSRAALPRRKPETVPAAAPSPDDLFAAAPPEATAGQPARPRLCAIEGAEIERVAQPKPDIAACQVPVPVEVAALSVPQGVDLRPDAVLACAMASDFAGWVREVVAPAAVRYLGAPLAGVRIAASYHCRRRNNQPTGKYSEHATGGAIDISAFRLGDGRLVTIADGWKGKGDEKAFLQHVREEACARFLTVLSPDGDAYHQDHMHLDQGCHGKTCTYRICS